ncbi:MAG TPA: hypothetical protein VG796_22770 [Verrucomicrobiales bacterium]|nr:hypothetical protein [Verrucomicrobiales bacterium]
MSTAVTPSVGTGKPEASSRGDVAVFIQVVLALVLGWLGVNALMETILESRARDAAAAQEFFDSRRQEDHSPAAAAPAKATPQPVAKAGPRNDPKKAEVKTK